MQITGHVIRSRYIYVRQRGEEAYQKVLAELGPDARKIMEEQARKTKLEQDAAKARSLNFWGNR